MLEVEGDPLHIQGTQLVMPLSMLENSNTLHVHMPRVPPHLRLTLIDAEFITVPQRRTRDIVSIWHLQTIKHCHCIVPYFNSLICFP